MPYDHSEIARQIAASLAQARAAHGTRADATRDAAEIYQATAHDDWRAAVESSHDRRLMGLPHTPLHEFAVAAPAGQDYTVVATDSSFVPPDKHRGSYCYLINVGRVMVHYGDEPAAELDSTAAHHIDPLIAGEDWLVSGPLLQAQCALQELFELHTYAVQFGADLALFDGSLMQLWLALSPDPAVKALMAAYGTRLAEFERSGVPLVSYISKPTSQAVMHAARVLGCRAAREAGTPGSACEGRCDRAECSGLWTLDDGGLFWELLDEGARSPVFRTHAGRGGQATADFWTDIGFCYVATPYEIARLEFPLWVVDRGLLDRAQSIVLRQCRLGDGYPKVLTLAHNFAVLRAADRESYFFLLERAGLIAPPSEKARGKRATGGRI